MANFLESLTERFNLTIRLNSTMTYQMDHCLSKATFWRRPISPLARSVAALGPYDGDWHSNLMRSVHLSLESASSQKTRELLLQLLAHLQSSDECAHALTRKIFIPPRLTAPEIAQSIADQLPCESIEAQIYNDHLDISGTLRGTREDAIYIFEAAIDRGLTAAKRRAISEI